MLLRQLYEESLAHAAYLVGCQRSGDAIVVDPSRDVDRYIDEADRHDLRISAVTETHIHADFLSGARELAERTGARLYLSGHGGRDWSYGWLGAYDHRLLADGDTFAVGGLEFRALHTPGHTPEHLCFAVTDRGGGADRPMGIFSGDFVFVGDLGRPDLLETAAGIAGAAEESARALGRSARGFLAQPDYLQVWPAHGAGSACGKALGAVPQTTVGYERMFNPALARAGEPAEFVRFILDGQPEPPLYFARMKRLNRDGVPLVGALPRPAELGPRDVAAFDRGRIVIDTREWEAFRAGHLAGSLHAPLGTAFHSVVGSYVTPEEPIVLVCEPREVEDATRELVRIGLDRVTGFVPAALLARGDVPTLPLEELDVTAARTAVARGEVVVLDVRRGAELGEGSIDARAIHVAHTRLPERLDAIPRGRRILVHCAYGQRSRYAVAYLRRAGYDAVSLDGGYDAWLSAPS